MLKPDFTSECRNMRSGPGNRFARQIQISVFGVSFMVKLLRACVGMPRRQKAMKDAASSDMLREGASNL